MTNEKETRENEEEEEEKQTYEQDNRLVFVMHPK